MSDESPIEEPNPVDEESATEPTSPEHTQSGDFEFRTELPEVQLAGEDRSVGNGLLIVASISLMLVVAAAIYVVGAAGRAADDAEAALERSEAILDQENDFTSVVAPESSLPLADDTTTTTTAPSVTTTTEAPEPNGKHPEVDLDPENIAVAFVNRAPGDDYGKVGVMTFAGDRVITELECSRIDLNSLRGICLNPGDVVGGPFGLITDEFFKPLSQFPIATPSRAAVSPDGGVVAWTGFSVGDSYLSDGEFSTTTQLISVERKLGANLESSFTTFDGDTVVDSIDRNFWGISFLDSDRFYATVRSNGETSIVAGKVSTSEMQVLWKNASCPSVSPDGSTVVVKEQRGESFQLVAIDVVTGNRRDLGETRSVDDQVEWLDNDSILYGLPNDEEGTDGQPAFDIWVLGIEAGAQPRLLVPFADSPAAP